MYILGIFPVPTGWRHSSEGEAAGLDRAHPTQRRLLLASLTQKQAFALWILKQLKCKCKLPVMYPAATHSFFPCLPHHILFLRSLHTWRDRKKLLEIQIHVLSKYSLDCGYSLVFWVPVTMINDLPINAFDWIILCNRFTLSVCMCVCADSAHDNMFLKYPICKHKPILDDIMEKVG